jgi:hypothetical protein
MTITDRDNNDPRLQVSGTASSGAAPQPLVTSPRPRPFKMMRKSSMIVADTGELVRSSRLER